MVIEQLHQLNKEITGLECKYDEALNWLFTTRKELITVLSALNRGDIDIIKEQFPNPDDEFWESYKFQMNSYDYIVETLNKKV
jgi:hypothetical protein